MKIKIIISFLATASLLLLSAADASAKNAIRPKRVTIHHGKHANRRTHLTKSSLNLSSGRSQFSRSSITLNKNSGKFSRPSFDIRPSSSIFSSLSLR